MILDAITKKLEIVLGGAVAANQLPFQCEWVDNTASAATPGTNGGLTNSATPVDLVGVPGGSTQRIVRYINIFNADTSPVTVTVRFNDNATLRTLKTVALAVGDTLTWGVEEGWEVVDSSGNKKNNVNTGNWIKTTVLSAGTSFVTQPGTHTIFIRLVGGGGGGGGGDFTTPNMGFGAGGAAGGYAEKTFAVSPLTAYTYAIGGAGTAGANTGGTGGTGGDTTFAVGGTTVTAKGGLGGVGQVGAATLASPLGGAGVIPTLGDINMAGAHGENSVRLSGILGSAAGGGNSPFGGGGAGRNTNGAGIAATGFGGGGGGGAGVSADQTGGAGTAGCIIVDEFA
jgi:hypothetical protein